jgi:hypothetical protein
MGMSEQVVKQRQLAAGAIDALGQAYDELHEASGKLAEHCAARYRTEREALPLVLAMPVPGSEKPRSVTNAETNLDLAPIFKAWRERRNELTGHVRFGEAQVAVLSRLADMELTMLKIAGEST